MFSKQTVFLGILCLTMLLGGTLVYVTGPFSDGLETFAAVHSDRDESSLVGVDLSRIPMPMINSQAEYNATIREIIEDLLGLRIELVAIWRFSRGEKVRRHTRNALKRVEKRLRSLGMTKVIKTSSTQRSSRRSEDVCPDNRQASTVDQSLQFKYVLEPCSYGKPLHSLVTVAINMVDSAWSDIETIRRVVGGITTYNKDIRIVVATSQENVKQNITDLKAECIQIPATESSNAGKAWNTLIGKARTPYVLIGRGLEWFTSDLKLERLVREISELGVSVVAGSSRTLIDGRWALGCHQTDLMNYTLKYEAGYYESMHECVFCDYVTGPFVARTQILAKLKFDESSFRTKEAEGLFEDLFFRLQGSGMGSGSESVVCPDSMFYQRRIETSSKKSDWQAYARKWQFNRLIAVGGHDLKFSCKEIATKCPKKKGLALAPCCLQDLADGLKFISRFCDQNKMTCETVGGTILGALKFDTVLPWERDGDIRFLSANYTTAKSLKGKFAAAGYKIGFSDGGKKDCKSTLGGSASVGTAYWSIDFWAVCIATSESQAFVQKGMSPTKINIDGYWINTRQNPGSYSRDRYGEDIYTHVEHYMTTGGHSYSKYLPAYFAPCPATGRVESSGCLDQYFPDGSIQFG